MINILQTWQGNVALFYVFVVIFYQCYKLAVKHTTNDGAATILLQCIAGTSILALAPFFTFKIPTSLSVGLLLIAACMFYAISDRLQMTARKHLQVSSFSLINQLGVVFLVLYGITIFKEPVVITKLLGAALIVGAAAALLYKPQQGRIKVDHYTIFAICATLAFATAVSIDIGISQYFNLPVYICLTLVVPALFIAGTERIRPQAVLTELRQGSARLFLITGIAWGLSIFFALRAFQFGEVSVIVPLQSAAALLNIIVAYIFLKERDRIPVKIIGGLVIVGGVVLTVL